MSPYVHYIAALFVIGQLSITPILPVWVDTSSPVVVRGKNKNRVRWKLRS